MNQKRSKPDFESVENIYGEVSHKKTQKEFDSDCIYEQIEHRAVIGMNFGKKQQSQADLVVEQRFQIMKTVKENEEFEVFEKGDINTIKLPIEQSQEQICEAILNNQVAIVSGDTGCGKSTQIPQYIRKMGLKKQEKYKIICTQPRRIACINLAKRVAQEITNDGQSDKQLGDIVGYQIGLESVQDRGATEILYVTNGIFLQRLIHDKDKFLGQFTHIILDEVHERDIDSDFIMISLKHFLADHPTLQLILMSATINAQLFAEYFSVNQILSMKEKSEKDFVQRNPFLSQMLRQSSKSWFDDNKLEPRSFKRFEEENEADQDQQDQWSSSVFENNNSQIDQNSQKRRNFIIGENDQPAQLILIPSVKRFSVKQFYMDEIAKTLKKRSAELDIAQLEPNLGDYQFLKDRIEIHPQMYDITLNLIALIISQQFSGDFLTEFVDPIGQPGAILVFLPGYNEIATLNNKIQNNLNPILNKIFEQLNRRQQVNQQFNQTRDINWRDLIEVFELHSHLSDPKSQSEFMSPTQNQRKIILSTNMAESSITIPDCVYVIDFCMIKELRYNHQTYQQSLELCWTSQASLEQRKGRVGRVMEGFNFRLIYEDFERGFTNFSTAEILRCPLEQLILKIKILDAIDEENIYQREKMEKTKNEKSEALQLSKREFFDRLEKQTSTSNNENSAIEINQDDYVEFRQKEESQFDGIKVQMEKSEDQSTLAVSTKIAEGNMNKRIFADPDLVLFRAIDPPNRESVGRTMQNLQQLGALDVSGNEYTTMQNIRITLLGRFFCEMPCDIRVSRLICLSELFECQLEAITIGAILSQRKSLFIPSVRRQQENYSCLYFARTITYFDDLNESDMILSLRIFKEWESTYLLRYILRTYNKNFNQVEQQMSHTEKQMLIQSFYNDPNSQYNIKRFSKGRIDQEEYNFCYHYCIDPFVMREILVMREDFKKRLKKRFIEHQYIPIEGQEGETNINQIKAALAAAFTGNVITSDINETKSNEDEMKSMRERNIDPFQTLIIETTIYEDELEKLNIEEINLFQKLLVNSIYQLTGISDRDLQVEAVHQNVGKFYVQFKERNYYTIQAIQQIIMMKVYYAEFWRMQIQPDRGEQDQNLASRLRNSNAFLDFQNDFLQTSCLIRYHGQCAFVSNDKSRVRSVIVDTDSIGNIVFSIQNGHPRHLVSYEILERQNFQEYARYCTAISEKYPLMMVLMGMVFGNFVELSSDESGEKYSEVTFDGLSLKLGYYLFNQDIDKVNRLRGVIKRFLVPKNEGSRSEFLEEVDDEKRQSTSLWSLIEELVFQRQDVEHEKKEEWEAIFFAQNQSRQVSLPGKTVQIPNRAFQRRVNEKEKLQFSTPIQGFMLNIEKRKFIQEDFVHLDSYQRLLEEKLIKQAYNYWKKEELFKLYRNWYLGNITQAMIGCQECLEKKREFYPIAPFSKLKYYQDDDQLQTRVRQLVLGLWSDQFIAHNEAQQNAEFREFFEGNQNDFKWGKLTEICNLDKDPKLYQYYSKIDLWRFSLTTFSFIFLGCKNNHIFGFGKMNTAGEKKFSYNVVIPFYSKLNIIFPSLETEKLDFSCLNSIIIQNKERQYQEKMAIIEKEMRFTCVICYMDDRKDIWTGESLKAFNEHLKDKKHQDKELKFTQSFERVYFEGL